MPPRKATTATRKRATSAPKPADSAPDAATDALEGVGELAPGRAVRLADGGEAVFLVEDADFALLRVGTGHDSPFRVPLESLEAVFRANETDRHVKFRAEALRRGEIRPPEA